MAQKKQTGWVGWVYFASAMMLLVGALQFLSGLVAIFKHTFYVVSGSSLIAFNYHTWGIINLIIGGLIFLAGLAIMSGQAWGRAVGIFLAILGALSNLAFIDAYPIWAVIGTTINVLVIYALSMHGDEV